jgi:hypothetical protein
LMIRQAISPRFAIRIRLNIFSLTCNLGRDIGAQSGMPGRM